MKDQKEVINDFNEVVNMTAKELEGWLKSGDSKSAGWPKDDGDESVGHDSGRKIVEILKANPGKEPDKYTEEQIEHMRKVVSYCKRHLAQEEKSNNSKPAEEVKKTKSYASLKNWGHDPLKKRGEADANGGDNDEAGDTEEEKQAGNKRKASAQKGQGSSKKRETRQGKAAKKDDDENDDEDEGDDDDEEYAEDDGDDEGQEDDADEGEGDDDKDDVADDKENSKSKKSNGRQKQNGGSNGNGGSKTASKGPEPGDTVSWNWGNGQPEGKVLDVKPEKTSIETKRGNQVSRDGTEDDPAVVLDTGKSKAIKSNHELN